ncbi:hypothetical protein HT031_006640 [Scenedesmus sp. PABB004]|nr:hypothetical protein HT031_006640 [Scenedesmus sp. PABB004]
MATPPPAPRFSFICFSDIDGTLVHYLDPSQLQEVVGELLLLPQSATGRLGVISRLTLEKAAALRAAGGAFVLVSGARTSTVLQRLPFLPAADAVVAENGGRIWYPDPQGLTACPLVEDLEWRQQLAAVAGPPGQDVRPPLEREGVLWEWYRELHRQGWRLDSNSYSTCFRLTPTPGRGEAELRAAVAAAPPGVASSVNLGVTDFYPAASGKQGAAARLMARWGVQADRCGHLGDDDNDLALAAAVGKAFLPSVGAQPSSSPAAAPCTMSAALRALARGVAAEAPKATRTFRTSAGPRSHYDYEHGPNYLNFQDWPGRQWKVAAWVCGVVGSGVAIPAFAVWWQQSKLKG